MSLLGHFRILFRACSKIVLNNCPPNVDCEQVNHFEYDEQFIKSVVLELLILIDLAEFFFHKKESNVLNLNEQKVLI